MKKNKETKVKEVKKPESKKNNQKKIEPSIPITQRPLGFLRASLSGYSDCLSIL